jgi:hypothetical protein
LVPPTLFINPRTDAAFVDLVEREAITATSPADLRARLSKSYPKVVIRQRALEGERADIWYVYRDGRWVAE